MKDILVVFEQPALFGSSESIQGSHGIVDCCWGYSYGLTVCCHAGSWGLIDCCAC